LRTMPGRPRNTLTQKENVELPRHNGAQTAFYFQLSWV
jgi:hypothetical protein